jgi:ADP-L-glycero-D-manno-heptose 6-epimerase
MNVLITGSKGFIGSNLISFLKKHHSSGIKVDGFDQDLSQIPKYPDCSKYDWVIHLGAISSTTEKDVNKILKYNLDYSVKLMSLCESQNCNFQYASSASVYGNTGNFSENGPIYPLNAYAWSKYLFDRHVAKTQSNSKVLIQGFRYFNVYGNNEELKGDQASPVTKFTQQAKSSKIIKLFKNSDNYFRDFVCVKDICLVHLSMLSQNVSGIFNVGTGAPISFQEVGDLISKKYNADINYIPMPENLKDQYQSYTKSDTSKLKKYFDLNFMSVKDFLLKQS